MDDARVTIIHLEGGQFVRVGEQIGEVADLVGMALRDPGFDGFAPFTDPGDERPKLVRADRILWIEMEG